jgi:hypothetical protein
MDSYMYALDTLSYPCPLRQLRGYRGPGFSLASLPMTQVMEVNLWWSDYNRQGGGGKKETDGLCSNTMTQGEGIAKQRDKA